MVLNCYNVEHYPPRYRRHPCYNKRPVPHMYQSGSLPRVRVWLQMRCSRMARVLRVYREPCSHYHYEPDQTSLRTVNRP